VPDGVLAVVAGGGTGGHVYPGLAVAEVLVRAGVPHAGVHFVVSRRPADAAAVGAAGFTATPVHARGLQRRVTLANLVAAAALARGVCQSWRLLGRIGPGVVLAQGGYVSAACALAARLRRIPLVVLEANATAGLANRMAARWAIACAVGFPATLLPRKVVTGLPVREAIGRLHPAGGAAEESRRRTEARMTLGADPQRRLVLAVGGSQGSARLNAAVTEACGLLADRDDLIVRHVVGRTGGPGGVPVPESERGGLHYQVLGYEDDMPTALAAADLVVSRAGGSTVAELACAGRAAVLVPLPGATGDHQSANAAALADAGAAAVIGDSELDGRRLAGIIGDLLADPEGLAVMEQAAAALGEPGAAERVADLLREVASGERVS
jgi:undecaprenyldiphospho-muramoylpentapeptide beta-N-acetylglucosaminyltransferase